MTLLQTSGQASVTYLVEMPQDTAAGSLGERRGFAKPKYDVSTPEARAAMKETTEATARLFPMPDGARDRNWEKASRGDRDRGLLARAVGSSEVDQLLGLNCLAEEKFCHAEDGVVMGLSVEVDGAQVLTKVQPEGGGRDVLCSLAVDYRDPRIQKGLSDLEVLDYITGQLDRHEGNIVINPSTGKVKGIDNDLAFPRPERSQVYQDWAEVQSNAVGTLPQQIHSQTAKRLLQMDPQEMAQRLLQMPVPEGCNALTAQEVAGAVTRLKELQAAVRDPQMAGIQVVREFNQQTYDAAMEKQHQACVSKRNWTRNMEIPALATGPNGQRPDWASLLAPKDMEKLIKDMQGMMPKSSYLGGAVKFQAVGEMGVLAMPDTFGVRQPETAKQALRTPVALEARMQDLMAERAALEAKLQGYQNRLQKLEDPGAGLVLKSLRYGGVDNAREAFLSKENETSRRLREISQEMGRLHPEALRTGMPQALDFSRLEGALERARNLQATCVQPLDHDMLSPAQMARVQGALNGILRDSTEPFGKPGSLEMDLKGLGEAAVMNALDRQALPQEAQQLERFVTGQVHMTAMIRQMEALQADMEVLKAQGFPAEGAEKMQQMHELETELSVVEVRAAVLTQPPLSRAERLNQANADLAVEKADLAFETRAIRELKQGLAEVESRAEGLEMQCGRTRKHETLDSATVEAVKAEAEKLLQAAPDTYGRAGSLDVDVQTLAGAAADAALGREVTRGELNQIERVLMHQHVVPAVKAELKALQKEAADVNHQRYDAGKMATLATRLGEVETEVNVAGARARVLVQPPGPEKSLAVEMANEKQEGHKKTSDTLQTGAGVSYRPVRPQIGTTDTSSSTLRSKV